MDRDREIGGGYRFRCLELSKSRFAGLQRQWLLRYKNERDLLGARHVMDSGKWWLAYGVDAGVAELGYPLDTDSVVGGLELSGVKIKSCFTAYAVINNKI